MPDVLAAVDLGSNSFHMVVARYSHGQLVILDRLREMVRLAAGLGDSGRLDDAATERALRCLERFGQRLRAMRADSVRVVGTNALRRAKRKRWFLERARAALGHPIEIISGLEEARLIYSGVVHTSPMSPDKRLVIDIGGGSTEVVIGEGFNPLLLESLGIDRVRVAEGAMREGLLYDLMGRFTNEDARVRSVRAMEKRYHIDETQADRVEATAVGLLEQVESEWGLEDPLAESVLRWAARLHETGLDIAHSKYHRHSAYLLEHADMPGFPREEQLLLAALVGGHRRQLSFESLEDLLPPWDRLAEFLIVVVRLAVLLHRGRSPQPLPDVRLTVKSRNITLELPLRWIKEHPLTLEDLEQERAYLKEAGFRLTIV